MKDKKLKFSKALFWIFLSTAIIFSFNFYFFQMVKKYKKKKLNDHIYDIEYISQTPSGNSISSEYISELLDLSKDNKKSFQSFDEKLAEEKLLRSNILKNPKVKKISPNNILVDYVIRDPVALLYDIDNFAIDNEGYIFPFKPIFKKTDLPFIYLNLNSYEGYKQLSAKSSSLALEILKKLKQAGFLDLIKVKIIDTSRIYEKSYGKREIIISIDEEVKILKDGKLIVFTFPKLLRLGLHNYLEQLSNYVSLREKMLKDYEKQLLENNIKGSITFMQKTIDLRVSKLAFIDK